MGRCMFAIQLACALGLQDLRDMYDPVWLAVEAAPPIRGVGSVAAHYVGGWLADEALHQEHLNVSRSPSLASLGGTMGTVQ